MSDRESWEALHTDNDVPVKVCKVVANTHSELGQQLLSDPLSLAQEKGWVPDEEGWRVHLQITNADIPSGPLPLPEEIPDDLGEIWKVIRKLIAIFTVLEDLKLVVVVVARYKTNRDDALKVVRKSRKARRNKNRGSG